MRSFATINNLSKNLRKAAKRIEIEYEDKGAFLWEEYELLKGSDVFTELILQQKYDEFIKENGRLKEHSKDNYSCSIEDFINKNLIDITLKKNMYNLVPGSMTGLGILGTFIGLSFGLKEFNTGSSAEISNSIAPLMDGLKVAFHTSIYGMVFSLLFNVIYKKLLDVAYDSLDMFLHSFNIFVRRDSDYTNESNLRNILLNMPEEIGQQILNTLSPAFNNMNTTLETFSEKVSKSEMEGISNIVDSFIYEMNKSLGDNFTHLGETIEQTCELQKQNSEFMQNILNSIGDMTQNIKDVNELSVQTVDKMSEYVNRLEELQKVINENFTSVNIQLESQNEVNEKMKGYVESLSEHQKLMAEATDKLSSDLELQIANLTKLEKDLSENSRTNMEMLLNKAKEYSDSLSEVTKKHIEDITNLTNNQAADLNGAAQELSRVSQQLNTNLKDSLNNTFDCFDTNLSEIAKHLSGTISEVDATTERVPNVVVAAYDGMEKSFDEMQTKLESLIHALDIMQRNLPRIVDKIDKAI